MSTTDYAVITFVSVHVSAQGLSPGDNINKFVSIFSIICMYSI